MRSIVCTVRPKYPLSAILFGSLELAETLWKVALYNLESIDCFYSTTFRPCFRAICVMVKKPNFVYRDLILLKWPTGVLTSLGNGLTYSVRWELCRSVVKRWFDWVSNEASSSNRLEMAIELLNTILCQRKITILHFKIKMDITSERFELAPRIK